MGPIALRSQIIDHKRKQLQLFRMIMFVDYKFIHYHIKTELKLRDRIYESLSLMLTFIGKITPKFNQIIRVHFTLYKTKKK